MKGGIFMNIKKKAGLIFIVLCFTMLFSMTSFAGKYTGTKKGKGSTKIILVGDSRVMHMASRNADHTEHIYFVYGNGCSALDLNNNFDGFKTKLNNALKAHKSAKVVFMLGVNGNSSPSKNIDQIEKAYKYYKKHYGGHTYIISTVGKTIGRDGSYSNKHVVSLNKKIISAFSNKTQIFDLYSLTDKWIDKKKETSDGLHYKSGTYNKILNKVKDICGVKR